MHKKLQTRNAALEAGEPRYYTGRPCKHGHLSERYTKNSACIDCNRVHSKQNYLKDPQKAKDYHFVWRYENSERVKAANKRNYAKHRDKYAHRKRIRMQRLRKYKRLITQKEPHEKNSTQS